MKCTRRGIETDLIAWKEKRAGRMPLIVSGVRQVGKTYLLRRFDERHFKDVVYVNLEINLAVTSFSNSSISPEELLRYLETPAGEKIIAGETLAILDEIQSYERTLTSPEYFCERTPESYVAAAGSLLGVAINRQQYSFPVGKVEALTIYPLDFEEYLWAGGRVLLCEETRSTYGQVEPLPGALYEETMELYREYLTIGGMPACINAFLKTRSFLGVPLIRSEILDNYTTNMAKYASSSDSVKTRACYQLVLAQLAKGSKKSQYKVVQGSGSTMIFGTSIEWLGLAGVVLKCQRLQHVYGPVAAYADLPVFRLYMGNVGLPTMKSGISQETILAGAGSLFMGAVAENYVTQQLAARGYNLYYWESGGKTELDFVLQKGNKIIGIEVEAGEHVRSRNLNAFAQAYGPAYCICFPLKNFGMGEKVEYIPLYTAFCIQTTQTTVLWGKKSVR